MSRRVDETGNRYGRLEVKEFAGVRPGINGTVALWWCQCECGEKTKVSGASLRRGYTKSCGCIASETCTEMSSRHGKCGTRIYVTWRKMLERCNNPNHVQYQNYGGRGIKVEFATFEEFYACVGDPPSGMTIDRINNDGNYAPGNVKWSTTEQQSNNKRTNHLIEHGGQTMSIAQWSRALGIPKTTILSRIRKGRPPFEECR